MGYTFMNIEEPDTAGEELYGRRSHWKLWFVVLFIALVACFLRWGGYLIETWNSLPEHVDAAVILQGAAASEKARIAAAMLLLRQGTADRIVLIVPKESQWGEEVAPIARQYLEKNYGKELAGKVDICETGTEMSSTQQEEQALTACIQDRGWKTIALVTSNYDSRRAEMVWRRTLAQRDSSLRVAVEGVADSEYQPRGWWRQRLSAKIWLLEFTQLVWAIS